MRKSKIFSMNQKLDKVEAAINEWLAQNPEKTILHTAGTNVCLILIYED